LEVDPGAGGWSRETLLFEAPANPPPLQRRSSEGAAGGGGSGGGWRRDGARRRGGDVGGRRRAAAAGAIAAPLRFPCSPAAAAAVATPYMLGLDGRRLGSFLPFFSFFFLNRFFTYRWQLMVIVCLPSVFVRGKIGNQMMYSKKWLHRLETNSKDHVKKIA
jgi:hypothetical protein